MKSRAEICREAVRALGIEASREELVAWVGKHYPKVRFDAVNPGVCWSQARREVRREATEPVRGYTKMDQCSKLEIVEQFIRSAGGISEAVRLLDAYSVLHDS